MASRNAAPASLRLPKFFVSQPCGERVPNFRYRALTQSGEIVNGTLSAPTVAEEARRVEYLRLLPIGTGEDKRTHPRSRGFGPFGRPSAGAGTTLTPALAPCPSGDAALACAL